MLEELKALEGTPVRVEEAYTPLTCCTCLDLTERSVTSSRAKVLERDAMPYIRFMAMPKPLGTEGGCMG